MNILLTTACLQLIALAVHLIVWRLRLPRRHIRALLVIFGTTFVVWLVAVAPHSTSLPDVIQIGLCYISISLAYTITYSAIEGDSPTLSLILLIAQNGSEGVRVTDVAEFLSRRPFIQARLAALAHSGLIREDGDRIVLAGRPSLAFRIILNFRKIFGPIPKGG